MITVHGGDGKSRYDRRPVISALLIVTCNNHEGELVNDPFGRGLRLQNGREVG